jgi:predicted alpha/beta hydrolase
LAKSAFANQGQRVVEGQRLMQSSSDIFLGWDRVAGEDGVLRDFYLRQLWDWKLSADIDTMLPTGMSIYAQMCGWTLALAHARSGDAIAIGSYLGAGDRFDRAMVKFASSYADQNEKDFESLKRAIAANEVYAISDV